MRKPIKYPYKGELTRPCMCGQMIYFVYMPSGKAMPVNYNTRLSHFIDCPMAKGFKLRHRKVNNYRKTQMR